ncbi:MAG: hypothetical protein FJ279_22000 [Planctomycetes bacterium]|nr:hypothetical protein [Planctomycetota bacterium]
MKNETGKTQEVAATASVFSSEQPPETTKPTSLPHGAEALFSFPALTVRSSIPKTDILFVVTDPSGKTAFKSVVKNLSTEYRPMSVRPLRPFYRNNIYASENLKQLVFAVELSQESYLNWLLPLPKEVNFLGKVRVLPGEFELVLDEKAPELVRAAAEELRAFLKEKGHVDVRVAATRAEAGKKFSVRLGLRSDKVMQGIQIPDMAALPNAEQAYAVVPIYGSNNLVSGIALVGQGESGAYYAVQTFRQLLEAGMQESKAAGVIALPVASIRDWPDLGERGFWGSYNERSLSLLPVLSRRKFNLIETHVQDYKYDSREDGRGKLSVSGELIAAARRHAIRIVPIITHLGHLPAALFEKRPELHAAGDSGCVAGRYAFCHAKPEVQKVLAEWMASLAQLPGIDEVSAWLSENAIPGGDPFCSCAECRKENWFVGEARLFVEAGQEARKVNPKLRLRILLTQGSYPYNGLVLKTVPSEVGITYYSGGKTYTVSREPMIYPLLREYASSGRWLGVYPQLLAVSKYNMPFPCPQLVHARAKEFVEAELKNVCWRLHPVEWPYYQMNFDAAAEWSWNANGRSAEEFVEAWATREGFKDPAKVAEWVDAIGPVAWDVHDGTFPLNFYQKLTTSIARGELKLGEGLFRGFGTREAFEEDLAACIQAAQLAEEIGDSIVAAETRVITADVTLLESLYLLSEEIARGELTEDARASLQKAIASFDASVQPLLDALQEWYGSVQSTRRAQAWRFKSTAEEIEDNCAHISTIARRLAAQTRGTVKVLMGGFGKPETLGGRTAFNADETGRGDGAGGAANLSFVANDFETAYDLHLLVWGTSDPPNLIICTEGQGKGYASGGKWTRVNPRQGKLSGKRQWDELVYRLRPELYDREGRRQNLQVGGGDSQIWLAECWIERAKE